MSGTLLAAFKKTQPADCWGDTDRWVHRAVRSYHGRGATLQECYDFIRIELVTKSRMLASETVGLEAAILSLQAYDTDKERWNVLMSQVVEKAKLEGLIPAE